MEITIQIIIIPQNIENLNIQLNNLVKKIDYR